MKRIRCGWCTVLGLFLLCSPLHAQDFTLYDLYAVDLQRGTTVRLTSIPNAGEYNPSWSPDGKYLVHDVTTIDAHALYITDAARYTSTPLPGADGGDDAAWSPDGKLIAFDRVPYGDRTIYVLPRAGGIPRSIRTDAIDPSWNPTSTALAFCRPSDRSIRTVTNSTGAERFVGYGEEPAWSPDGSWIVFTQSGDLWKVPVDRQGAPRGPALLVTSGWWWDGRPAWSGDSRTIFFHSNRGGDFDIWRVNKDGGTPQRVTGLLGAGDYDPSVSLDGRRLVLAAVGPGSSSPYPPFAKYDNPFSIVVQPLKGPETTDIAVRVLSSNPLLVPVPSLLKKLQIRAIGQSGECVLNREFNDLPVNDGQTIVSLRGLDLFQPLRVLVVVPADGEGKEFVVRAVASVLLRPDLFVDGVNAPAEIRKRLPFNVEARIKEKNIRVGTTCTISLSDGFSPLGTVPGVWVTGGGQVSVVFEGIRIADPGVHVLTVRITDAKPAEYDVTNNDYSFPVNVLDVEGVEPMQYSMSYWTYHSTYQYQFRSCWQSFDETTQYDIRSFYYYAYLSLGYQVPGPPFDLFAWKIETEEGVWNEGSVAGAVPDYAYSSEDYSYESYSFLPNPSKPFFGYLYVSRGGGFSSVSMYIAKYASRTVYRRSENGTITESTYEDGWPGLLASKKITTSLLLRDEGFSAGGGASVDISMNPPSTYAGTNSGFNSYYLCDWTETYSNAVEGSNGFSSGTTNPTQLPLAKANAAVFEPGRGETATGPTKTGLLTAYPNPFNPSTTITFVVDREGPVSLEVFNVLGERMCELFNGPAASGQSYRVTFDGSAFPSGIYFTRLQAAGKNVVGKMMLAK